ncbi:RagB/SusD family nutrient uptake outer membrane protein, partial [Pedobacter sp.]
MKIFDKIIRPLAIFLVMLSCSCSSFLDTQPQDFISKQNYYKTEAQAYAALNGVYSTLSNIATYANFMVGRMGLDADEGRESSASRILGPTVYNIESTDANIQAHWSILYAGINRANLLLESLDKITMDKTKKDVIKGETLFLRSYFYFMLVSKFGDVPLQLQSSSSKDINSIGSPRVSSVSVYTQITNDMIAAEALLPEITTVGHGGKLSKSAACGILGRVYLHWAGYPIADRSKYMEAEKWLNKVIYTGVHSLNPSYRQVFINYAQDTYDIKESIWEVEFWGDNSTEFQLSGRVGSTFGVPSDDPEKGRVTIFMAPNGWLYKSYAATDTRRDWNIAPFSYTGVPAVTVPYAASNIYARNIAKWRREYEKVANKNTIATPQNYPLLRYADVILMLAETRNEINDGPDAIAYEKINQVRR